MTAVFKHTTKNETSVLQWEVQLDADDWQWSYWQKKSETKRNHNKHLAERQRMRLKTKPLIKCRVWQLRFCLFWLTFTSQAHLMLQHVREISAHSDVICRTDWGKMKGEGGGVTRKWNGSFWVVKFQREVKRSCKGGKKREVKQIITELWKAPLLPTELNFTFFFWLPSCQIHSFSHTMSFHPSSSAILIRSSLSLSFR